MVKIFFFLWIASKCPSLPIYEWIARKNDHWLKWTKSRVSTAILNFFFFQKIGYFKMAVETRDLVHFSQCSFFSCYSLVNWQTEAFWGDSEEKFFLWYFALLYFALLHFCTLHKIEIVPRSSETFTICQFYVWIARKNENWTKRMKTRRDRPISKLKIEFQDARKNSGLHLFRSPLIYSFYLEAK